MKFIFIIALYSVIAINCLPSLNLSTSGNHVTKQFCVSYQVSSSTMELDKTLSEQLIEETDKVQVPSSTTHPLKSEATRSAIESSSSGSGITTPIGNIPPVPTITPIRMTSKGHQLGKSYSIMMASLPEQELSPSPLHYNEKWEEEYDAFINEQKSTNQWKDPPDVQEKLSTLYDDGYSAFIRNNRDGGGYTYVYGKNICYNTRSGKYVFLFDQNKLHLTNPTDAFRYGWHYSNTQRSKYNISAYWVDEEVYITQPFTIRHIYHFVESLNFLWLKLQYINEFPVMRSLWLPTFNPNTDYSWASGYLEVLLSPFKDNYNITLYNKLMIQNLSNTYAPSSHLICFRRALLLDRSHYLGEGGSLSGWRSADLFRAAAYKYAKPILYQPSSKRPITITLLQRDGPRRFVHPSAILRRIHNRYGSLVSAQLHYTNGSFSSQVRLLAESDLVVSAHGAGQTNIMFLRPLSAFVECNPPYFYETTFMTLANIVRVQYYSVTTYNETYMPPKVKSGYAQSLYASGRAKERKRVFVRGFIDPEPLNMMSVIDNAVEYLRYTFYRRSQTENRYLF